jgi:hypothetical protein
LPGERSGRLAAAWTASSPVRRGPKTLLSATYLAAAETITGIAIHPVTGDAQAGFTSSTDFGDLGGAQPEWAAQRRLRRAPDPTPANSSARATSAVRERASRSPIRPGLGLRHGDTDGSFPGTDGSAFPSREETETDSSPGSTRLPPVQATYVDEAASGARARRDRPLRGRHRRRTIWLGSVHDGFLIGSICSHLFPGLMYRAQQHRHLDRGDLQGGDVFLTGWTHDLGMDAARSHTPAAA